MCSTSSQIPVPAAGIRGCLAFDLSLRALELDSFLPAQVRATTCHTPLACGHKYFQTLVQHSRDAQSPVGKQRDLKHHQRLNCKVCYQVSGSRKEFCCKGPKSGLSENHYPCNGPCPGAILPVCSVPLKSTSNELCCKSWVWWALSPKSPIFLNAPCHVVVLVAVVIDLCLMSSCYWLRFF